MWYECSEKIWKPGNSFKSFSLDLFKDFIRWFWSGSVWVCITPTIKEDLIFASPCSRQTEAGVRSQNCSYRVLKQEIFQDLAHVISICLWGCTSHSFTSLGKVGSLCFCAEHGNELTIFESPFFIFLFQLKYSCIVFRIGAKSIHYNIRMM